MRLVTAVLAALLVSAGAALAAEAEGKIREIDTEALTITLDDGKSYRLPGEFDMTAIEEGKEVFLAYDVVDGVNLITDMEITE